MPVVIYWVTVVLVVLLAKIFSSGEKEKAYAAAEVTGTEKFGKFIGCDESNLTEDTCLLTISND